MYFTLSYSQRPGLELNILVLFWLVGHYRSDPLLQHAGPGLGHRVIPHHHAGHVHHVPEHLSGS
jgi:hypothetical protein